MRITRLAILAALAACTHAPSATTTTAAALPLARDTMVAVPGGRIFVRAHGTGDAPAIIAIHGGPGGTSCRMSPLAALARDGRRVVLYDQLGSGRSERPADTTLWRLPRFVQEIDSIRAALGLREVVVAGFSWGGTVALEYALERPRHGVRAVVLGSPLLSTRWQADADTLVMGLPPAVRRAIAIADSSGDYDAPAFLAAMDSFAVRHGSRTPAAPTPECAGVTGNRAIYRYMWGPSEFRSTGTLRTYDREPRLGELRVPVLLLGGEFDEARPPTLERFRRQIPGAELVVIPGAAHALLRDAPARVNAAIAEFLARRVR